VAMNEDEKDPEMKTRIEKVFEDLLHGGQRVMMPGEIGWAPAVDVYETETELVVIAEIAGVTVDEVSVVINRNIMRISGFRGYPRGDRKQKLHQMEIDFGRFERVIRLPMPIQEESVRASYRDGFLSIVVPKEARSPYRKIEIKAD